MRSPEIILILSLFFAIEVNDSLSISKFNWVAKRIARIIRNGSSEYVISGFKGVFNSLFSKSATPLNGSTKSPKLSEFREKAIALMVKSLRSWSSFKVPFSTKGFLLSCV